MDDVLSLKYMQILRTGMRHISAWPAKAVGEEESRFEVAKRFYVAIMDLVCLVPGLIYIRNNVGKLSFFELGHTYITVLMNITAFTRLSVIFSKKYHVVCSDFVKRIHLFHFKHQSPYSMETHQFVQKLSHIYTLYVYGIMGVGIILFNLTPLYKNYASGAFYSENLGNVTLAHSVYYALPFDVETDYKGYFCIFCFNWYISYICSTSFCTYDLLLSLMVFHVWGHLRILIYNLKNFDKSIEIANDDIWYSVKTNEEVSRKLRDIFMHHQLILQYLKMMSNTFGYMLFIYYGFHQACGCLLLLECSQMTTEAVFRYFPLTLILFQQLIQSSIIFELIGSVADRMTDAVYCLPWEKMDVKNRRSVHILLKQAQQSLNLKALGMVPVGVRTMVAILKTSFSYFVMMRTVAAEN